MNFSNKRNRFLLDIVFILLSLSIVLLRLYKSVEWFSFNFDEEYQAFLALSQVLDFHVIWIGVSAGNIGFYLGPAFTYLNAMLFFISRGDPAILAYFSPLLGLFTCISVFYVSSHIFDKRIGVISAIIYGLSPLLNFLDRRFWNPSLIPLLTVWLLFSLYKFKKNSWWLVLVFMIMATSLHIHLSLLIFWPILVYAIIKNRSQIPLRVWLVSIVSYLFVVSPLLVYDRVHNFDNLKTPLRVLSQMNSGTDDLTLFPHLGSFWSALSRFWYLRPHTSVQSEMGFPVNSPPTEPIAVLSIVSIVMLITIFFKSFRVSQYRPLMVMVGSSIFFYLIYPNYVLEYYLLSFFTLFSIVAGIFLSRINLKFLIPLTCLLFLQTAITIVTCNQSQYGLMARKSQITEVSRQVGDRPYEIVLSAKPGETYVPYGGWCYLFWTYFKRPVSCPADEYFGWIYPSDTAPKDLIKVVRISIPR